MHIVVIGGTGHIGTWLVPLLIEAGHRVSVVSRRTRAPYQPHSAWDRVEWVRLDRRAAEDAGTFTKTIRDIHPDVVIDLICFAPESARRLADALEGNIRHFLHCGTIWVHGYGITVPLRESDTRRPFGEYGTSKARIEELLLQKHRDTGFPGTVIHPGHISGPGWHPVNPQGNFNTTVFADLATGNEVPLPGFGLETLHHVHAGDIARLFMAAIEQPDKSIGESFHAVSDAALTLRGYAESVASWFGREAKLRFLPWEEWINAVPDDHAHISFEHIRRSSSVSMEKARRILSFQPRHSSLATIRQALQWMIDTEKTLPPFSG